MNASRRIIAIAAVVAFGTLAACGGESGPIAAPPDDDDVTTVPSDAPDTADSSSSPSPVTISPDLPEILEGEVGPTEVIGEPLPPHVSSPTTPIEADPAIGMEAPVVVGEDFDGSPVRINAVANGPTMAVFLAHWCSHCNAEIPEINRLRDEGRIPDGLNIVGVSTSLQPGQPNFPPSRWFEDKDWTFPVIADGVDMERSEFIATTAFGVTGFPFVTLIDGDGTVAARWSGERGADQFLALIQTYLGLT